MKMDLTREELDLLQLNTRFSLGRDGTKLMTIDPERQPYHFKEVQDRMKKNTELLKRLHFIQDDIDILD